VSDAAKIHSAFWRISTLSIRYVRHVAMQEYYKYLLCIFQIDIVCGRSGYYCKDSFDAYVTLKKLILTDILVHHYGFCALGLLDVL
jgi:hypothetical protein